MMINARFESPCRTCHQTIRIGEAILWTRGQAAQHVFCPVAAPAPAPVAAPAPTPLPNAHVILGLLRTAGSRLKWPKITLDQDGRTLRLQIAGPNSRYAGDVMITDGLPFGQNTWFGRITSLGEFVPSRNSTPWVVSTLSAFAADPAGYARRYGEHTGHCCFCNRELSTPESLTVGYGPICADHFELPWGAVADAEAAIHAA